MDWHFLDNYLEEVPCNLCKTADFKVWAVKDGFRIVECASCGLVFVNPRPNSKGLELAYGSDYFKMHTEGGALEKRIRMYDMEVKLLQKFAQGGKILDVGCGGGYFMSRFGNSWDKYGIEFNPVAAEAARTQFGLQVQVGEFPGLKYPLNFFDAVSMRGVIEHFLDPLSYLKKSHEVLKKGGVLMINTPNGGSLAARMYRAGFRLVAPPFHIYYFSPKTITALLEKAGFKVEKIFYLYLGTPYASWRDPFKFAADAVKLLFNRHADAQSPAFFDNVMHVIARK